MNAHQRPSPCAREGRKEQQSTTRTIQVASATATAYPLAHRQAHRQNSKTPPYAPHAPLALQKVPGSAVLCPDPDPPRRTRQYNVTRRQKQGAERRSSADPASAQRGLQGRPTSRTKQRRRPDPSIRYTPYKCAALRSSPARSVVHIESNLAGAIVGLALASSCLLCALKSKAHSWRSE